MAAIRVQATDATTTTTTTTTTTATVNDTNERIIPDAMPVITAILATECAPIREKELLVFLFSFSIEHFLISCPFLLYTCPRQICSAAVQRFYSASQFFF